VCGRAHGLAMIPESPQASKLLAGRPIRCGSLVPEATQATMDDPVAGRDAAPRAYALRASLSLPKGRPSCTARHLGRYMGSSEEHRPAGR
jgi:hypothetical protein